MVLSAPNPTAVSIRALRVAGNARPARPHTRIHTRSCIHARPHSYAPTYAHMYAQVCALNLNLSLYRCLSLFGCISVDLIKNTFLDCVFNRHITSKKRDAFESKPPTANKVAGRDQRQGLPSEDRRPGEGLLSQQAWLGGAGRRHAAQACSRSCVARGVGAGGSSLRPRAECAAEWRRA